ncbi:MAG: autorepressor SdpR family transcription factor [Caldisericum sp.]|uniref:autorepressor SdpR family transcription factor n=1 Tax=Caldisericum sp. TaxID=2499687 RepID=UPI003D11933F
MGLNDIFKALGDETRRKVLIMLSERDLTAGQIANAFNQSWPTISYHLEMLEKVGLITSERKGRNIVYSLNTTIFEEILVFFANVKSRRDKNG